MRAAIRPSLCCVILVSLTVISLQPRADANQATLYLYLAGPGVFLDDAAAYGERRKARIQALAEEHDWPVAVEGLYPLDNEIEDFAETRETGIRIYRANMAQLERAHAVIANMVRFRSPSMDVGTAFEMGVARGMEKPVFGYYDAVPFYGAADFTGTPPSYAERVAAYYDLRFDTDAPLKDPDGLNVERFAMTDNLMLTGALDDAGKPLAGSFDEAVINAVTWLLEARDAAVPSP